MEGLSLRPLARGCTMAAGCRLVRQQGRTGDSGSSRNDSDATRHRSAQWRLDASLRDANNSNKGRIPWGSGLSGGGVRNGGWHLRHVAPSTRACGKCGRRTGEGTPPCGLLEARSPKRRFGGSDASWRRSVRGRLEAASREGGLCEHAVNATEPAGRRQGGMCSPRTKTE